MGLFKYVLIAGLGSLLQYLGAGLIAGGFVAWFSFDRATVGVEMAIGAVVAILAGRFIQKNATAIRNNPSIDQEFSRVDRGSTLLFRIFAVFFFICLLIAVPSLRFW